MLPNMTEVEVQLTSANSRSDSKSSLIWEYQDYLTNLSNATLTLRELLIYFRQIDKLKSKQVKVESDSVFSESETEFLESSLFLFDNNGSDSTSLSCTSSTTSKASAYGRKQKNPLSLREKQKMEREAIRQKLSMENNDHEEFKYGADKPWYQPRFERSYSANNQSLQICYINESCSSGSDDEVSKLEKSDSSRNSSFSPASPMGFGSPRLYGKRYMKQHRSSDVSSHSSSTSSLTMPSPSMASDSTIISHNHHQDLRSGRSKQEELEMEARFQLAQAHQRAKLQAEEDRQKSRTQDKSSLAHRLLSVTLTDDINAKMKSYSLSRQDCQRMTLGQLQLILNDMHSKKQGLNDKLMGLLLARDDLQTEQDAKLVDVEDAKAVMNAVGPETTV